MKDKSRDDNKKRERLEAGKIEILERAELTTKKITGFRDDASSRNKILKRPSAIYLMRLILPISILMGLRGHTG